MANKKVIIKDKFDLKLYSEISSLINKSKIKVAQTINYNLTILYWNIGKQINDTILKKKRAKYGEELVLNLSKRLTEEFGKGWSAKQLRHCLRFAETFSDIEIVSSLGRQLSWTHFKIFIYIKEEIKRNFYIEMCKIENWSVRDLHKKIDSMLYERTGFSKKPEKLAKLELQKLSQKGELTPDLVFKSPYVLDFLNLKDTYQEKDLEQAILHEIEKFILELGKGFSFLERQKRMIIDNEDFYLDLLFFHRKLKRLVAIELKLGRFKPEYKGQMELYLNWLEKNEIEKGEEKPIGLILCAEGRHEQIELLQLEKSNIKVAEYFTEVLPKELLHKKLHTFYKESKKLIENRNIDEKELL